MMSVITTLKTCFQNSGLAILDGHVYAIGGWDGNSRLDSVEQYDPGTNSWSFIPPMKMALTSPAVATLRGNLYVTGEYGLILLPAFISSFSERYKRLLSHIYEELIKTYNRHAFRFYHIFGVN